jgi:hypothetical protein
MRVITFTGSGESMFKAATYAEQQCNEWMERNQHVYAGMLIDTQATAAGRVEFHEVIYTFTITLMYTLLERV